MSKIGDPFYKKLYKKMDKIETDTKEVKSLQEVRVKGTGKGLATIRFKLITAFFIPIIFIILLGLVSFKVASEGIVKNYEKAALQTIEMTGEYMRFGLDSVEATSLQYTNNTSVKNYFCNMYQSGSLEYSTAYTSIKDDFSAKRLSDDFIESISVLSEQVKPVTTFTKLNKGLYEGFAQTELGGKLAKNRNKVVWVGSDAYLDENMNVSPDSYSIRLIRTIPSASAMMVIDVSADTIREILTGLEFDKSGFLAFVTSDGKEITAEVTEEEGKDSTNAKAVFTGEKFYQNAVEAKTTSSAEYVSYKGETYLFMYSQIGKTGATLCALIPKSIIIGQVANIKMVTVIIVIIAIIIAIGTAVIISQGIDKTIKEIILRLKDAAKGDLTVQFKSKRKDEFQILIEEIQSTFTNMKKLIRNVTGLSTEVSYSSENVTKTSELFLKSSKDISAAMNEIEQGITQQAKDAEECLLQMDNLSQKIALVSDNTREIGQIADRTRLSIKEGTIVTEDLNNQTQSTIEITTDIINNIEKLDAKSLTISKIVNVINEIANQTNLLSLNASIEAARAGEYGRGFAVVASEIRKLAEQSQGSVNDINKIIDSILNDTKSAAETARKAGEVLKLQGAAVKNTTDSYQNINDSVEKLMVFLNFISQNVGNIEEARVSTLGAIENISAVLEEIAASSNTVNQNSNEQLSAVSSLNKEAEKLNQNSDILVQEVNKFKVE